MATADLGLHLTFLENVFWLFPSPLLPRNEKKRETKIGGKDYRKEKIIERRTENL